MRHLIHRLTSQSKGRTINIIKLSFVIVAALDREREEGCEQFKHDRTQNIYPLLSIMNLTATPGYATGPVTCATCKRMEMALFVDFVFVHSVLK